LGQSTRSILSEKAASNSEGKVLSWSGFFFFLFIYRCLASVFAERVIMKLTHIGDTWSYQRGLVLTSYAEQGLRAEDLIGLNTTIFSTVVTARIGGFFNSVLGGSPIMVNIGFQSITFIGLVYLLLSVEGQARKWLALLVMLPSFSIWTSMASKEAIVASAMAILSGVLLRMYSHRAHFGVLPIFATVTLYIYKPHYLIAILFGVVGTWICSKVQQKALVALTGGLFSILLLYLLRDKVDELAFGVQRLFMVTQLGASSRLEPFFIEQYDVFTKAPLGMFRAFMGPELIDIFRSPLSLITYAESTMMLLFLVVLVASQFRSLPIYNLLMALFVMFWIIFPNYPLGIMNIGTAIRYRSGWIILIIAAIVGLMTRKSYQGWAK
jgi:hypothetical protein